MGLEQYRLPNEDVKDLSERILQLFQRALPDPSDRRLYERFMSEGQEQGLTWLQSLEYAAARRVSKGECNG